MQRLSKILLDKTNRLIYNTIMNKLTDKEQKEPINMTIGRLRTRLISERVSERTIDLLEKISSDIERLTIKYPEDILI